ncbi:sortase [Candidatus Albibeggiatoa sp. nov. NOAA]|uniref:sortase domain-containing protein n=1 Tax=Candidatus Albibeggiatoa sp. nov. NOAA TaxID=3162724 RepID=UPI0032F56F7F|nr:sortase [Thiotrichaceae bacterium]
MRTPKKSTSRVKIIGGSLILGLFLGIGSWQLVENTEISDWMTQNLMHTAWLRTQASGEKIKPWPWAELWPIARLTVPHLNTEHIVLEQERKQVVPAMGLSYLKSSVLPGEVGNTVLGAHPSLYFSFLSALKPNDILVLESPRTGKWHYRVHDTKVVNKSDTGLLEPGLKRRLILVSCYRCNEQEKPEPQQNSLRYVVIAEEDDRLSNGL